MFQQECIPPACCPYLPTCTALEGGCTCPGGCAYPGGVPVLGCTCLEGEGGILAQVLLPVIRMTDNAKILPCPKLRLWAVITCSSYAQEMVLDEVFNFQGGHISQSPSKRLESFFLVNTGGSIMDPLEMKVKISISHPSKLFMSHTENNIKLDTEKLSEQNYI